MLLWRYVNFVYILIASLIKYSRVIVNYLNRSPYRTETIEFKYTLKLHTNFFSAKHFAKHLKLAQRCHTVRTFFNINFCVKPYHSNYVCVSTQDRRRSTQNRIKICSIAQKCVLKNYFNALHCFGCNILRKKDKAISEN